MRLILLCKFRSQKVNHSVAKSDHLVHNYKVKKFKGNFFNACIMHLLLLLFQPTNAQIYITNSISLYNVHSYMF